MPRSTVIGSILYSRAAEYSRLNTPYSRWKSTALWILDAGRWTLILGNRERPETSLTVVSAPTLKRTLDPLSHPYHTRKLIHALGIFFFSISCLFQALALVSFLIRHLQEKGIEKARVAVGTCLAVERQVSSARMWAEMADQGRSRQVTVPHAHILCFALSCALGALFRFVVRVHGDADLGPALPPQTQASFRGSG